jgi:NAD(P)H-dependent FMN reductase
MKVLGIAGSPRRGGNTDLLLAEVMRGAGESGAVTETVVLNNLQITPCQHCDACFEQGNCIIRDDMQHIYPLLDEADRVVLASPVQFMGPTAQLKAMIDRNQARWARKYVLKLPPLTPPKERKGFFIAVGGMKLENLFAPSRAIVTAFFKVLNIEPAGELVFPDIDEKGAIERCPEALRRAFRAGQELAAPPSQKKGC